METFVWACGLVALGLGLGAYAFLDDTRFKGMMGASCAVWVVHFGLLGAWAGGLSAATIGARTLASLVPQPTWVKAVLILAPVAVGWPGVHAARDTLPLLAALLAGWGMYTLKQSQLRQLMVFTCLLWVVYCWSVESWTGLANNGIGMALNVVSILRYRRAVEPAA